MRGQDLRTRLARLGRLFVSAVKLLLAWWVILEIGLRLLQAVHPTVLLPGRAYERFRVAPGSRLHAGDRVNAKGYHDVDHEMAKPPGTKRIVAVGDSAAFGVVPRRHTFLALTGDRLRGRGVEVVNLGVPSLGVEGYEAELEREGLAMEPDVVLVCFNLQNDFSDFAHDDLPTVSYVAALVHSLFVVLPEARRSGWGRGSPYRDDEPTLSEPEFLKIQEAGLGVYRHESPRFGGTLPRVVATLRRIASQTRAAGARLAVVILPAEIQVDPALAAHVIAAVEEDPARYDFDGPSRALVGILEGERIPVLDLVGAFRSRAAAQVLFKPRDCHANLAGNRLIADRLAPWLAEQLATE